MHLRNLVVTVLVVGSCAVLPLAGQEPQQAFDVVSIRPTSPEPGSLDFMPPGDVRVIGNRVQGRNVRALKLIQSAYGAEFKFPDQVIGGDDWVRSELFDVEARAATILSETPTFTLPPPAAQMLRRALQERFQLRIRTETRSLPRYALTYARADRSLKPGIRVSDRDCTSKSYREPGCEVTPLPGKFSMRGRPIAEFVTFLDRPAYSARHIVDQTGITSHVDIDFEWPMDFGDIMRSNAGLLVAIQEQLGLKLDARNLPQPILIIEAIQRPSAN